MLEGLQSIVLGGRRGSHVKEAESGLNKDLRRTLSPEHNQQGRYYPRQVQKVLRKKLGS